VGRELGDLLRPVDDGLGKMTVPVLRTMTCALLANIAAAAPGMAQDSPTSSGPGFFINADGWVLTNAHVVQECARVSVAGRGDATDIKMDRQNDLAAVKLPSQQSDEFVRFRQLPVRLGDDIVAYGFPLSGILSDSIKVTTGNINSLVGMDNDTRYLQISAPLQPGNSGGPVLDRDGNVLGIATSVLGQTFAGVTGILPQNVNFAVRSNVAELFLQSRSIEYAYGQASAPPLSTADLSEALVPSIVQVLCFSPAISESPSAELTIPAARGRDDGPSTEQLAEAFAIAYHIAWSSPNEQAIEFMSSIYGTSVDFYGNRISHSALVDEKRKFAERWPVRTYTTRAGSLTANCIGSTCTMTATVDWFAHSPLRQRSTNGVATFSFDLDTDEMKITREAGSVLKGQSADPSAMLALWEEQNSNCRGGSGDRPETWQACEAREHTQMSAQAAGWCYGREGQAGYEMDWHRCGN
jgi:S1-C subfamily serine protease